MFEGLPNQATCEMYPTVVLLGYLMLQLKHCVVTAQSQEPFNWLTASP